MMQHSDRPQFFDSLAETWEEENPVLESELERVVEYCELGPGLDVLDVGTGTGRLVSLLLNNVGDTGTVCGLDPSAGMLTVAQRRYQGPNVQFLQAGAEDVPLPDRSVDRVICYAVFPHFADRERAVAELARLLRTHGLLVIAHTKGREQLNSCHHRVGGPVQEDRLPPARVVATLLERHGLRALESIDDSEFYLVKAEKSE